MQNRKKINLKKNDFDSINSGVERNHARRTLEVYCYIEQTIVKLLPLN